MQRRWVLSPRAESVAAAADPPRPLPPATDPAEALGLSVTRQARTAAVAQVPPPHMARVRACPEAQARTAVTGTSRGNVLERTRLGCDRWRQSDVDARTRRTS